MKFEEYSLKYEFYKKHNRVSLELEEIMNVHKMDYIHLLVSPTMQFIELLTNNTNKLFYLPSYGMEKSIPWINLLDLIRILKLILFNNSSQYLNQTILLSGCSRLNFIEIIEFINNNYHFNFNLINGCENSMKKDDDNPSNAFQIIFDYLKNNFEFSKNEIQYFMQFIESLFHNSNFEYSSEMKIIFNQLPTNLFEFIDLNQSKFIPDGKIYFNDFEIEYFRWIYQRSYSKFDKEEYSVVAGDFLRYSGLGFALFRGLLIIMISLGSSILRNICIPWASS